MEDGSYRPVSEQYTPGHESREGKCDVGLYKKNRDEKVGEAREVLREKGETLE